MIFRQIIALASLMVLCCLIPGKAPAPGAQGTTIDADEELIADAGLGKETADLLDYLQLHSVQVAGADALQRLVRQLGSNHFEERETATRKLLAIGSVALPVLREAVNDTDVEIARRARNCLNQAAPSSRMAVTLATVRLLVKRGDPAAVKALLAFLPHNADLDVEEELYFGLDSMARDAGKIRAELVEALQDKAPRRRAVAGCLVGRRGAQEQRAAVGRLLVDPNPWVRLRVSQGLLGADDASGLSTLVGLLTEASAEIAWEAEELLHWAAGDSAPAQVVGAPGGEAGKACQAAWKRWLQTPAARVDFRQIKLAYHRPGLQLWCLADDAKPGWTLICLCGCDGKPRWQLRIPGDVWDLQWLSGDRLLLAQPDLNLVTERDLQGKIVWEANFPRPFTVQRLPNGNTFCGVNRASFQEVDGTGKPVQLPIRFIKAAPGEEIGQGESHRISGNGNIVFFDLDKKTLVECHLGTRRAVRRIPVNPDYNFNEDRIEQVSNGRYLLRRVRFNMVEEIDSTGRTIWSYQTPAPFCPEHLRNGSVMIGVNGKRDGWESGAIEVDRAGRKVWEGYLDQPPRTLVCVRPCLNLVRFGFDQPRPVSAYLDTPAYYINGLSDKSAFVRARSVRGMARLGRTAEPDVLKALCGALADSDKTVWQDAVEAMVKMGPAVVPLLLSRIKDPKPALRAHIIVVLQGFPEEGEKAGPAVLAALKDQDAEVRRAAALAIGEFKVMPEGTVRGLAGLLNDPDQWVVHPAACSLARLGPRAQLALPELLAAIRVKKENRGILAKALVRVGPDDPKVLTLLLELFDDPSASQFRSNFAYALGEIGPKARGAVPRLLKAVKTTDAGDAQAAVQLRGNAAMSLCKIAPEQEVVISSLASFLSNPNEDLGPRNEVFQFFVKLGPGANKAVSPLISVLTDPANEREMRRQSSIALGKIGPEALPPLMNALKNKDAEARRLAACALGDMGPKAKKATEPLQDLERNDPDPQVKLAATSALRKIQEKEKP